MIIDLNAWPSYAKYRDKAARRIADYLVDRFHRGPRALAVTVERGIDLMKGKRTPAPKPVDKEAGKRLRRAGAEIEGDLRSRGRR